MKDLTPKLIMHNERPDPETLMHNERPDPETLRNSDKYL